MRRFHIRVIGVRFVRLLTKRKATINERAYALLEAFEVGVIGPNGIDILRTPLCPLPSR